jgi:hypothetical protein
MGDRAKYNDNKKVWYFSFLFHGMHAFKSRVDVKNNLIVFKKKRMRRK